MSDVLPANEERDAMWAGRVIGVLLLLQMAGSAAVNFGLEAPLFAAPGYLVNAAPNGARIGLAAIVLLALESLSLGTAIAIFPVLGRRGRRMALLILALAAVTITVGVVEGAAMLSMRSLSEAYLKASPAQQAAYESLRGVVAAARNWPHYFGRMMDGLGGLAVSVALFRFRLVPRVVSGLAFITVPLMLIGIGMPFFGEPVDFRLLAPLGLSQLILALYLLAKGMRAPRTA